MSLEELLKDNGGSTWRGQKRRLVKVISGILVIVFILVGGSFFYFLSQKGSATENKRNLENGKESVQSLAQLMVLQKQAEALQKEVDELQARQSNRSKTNEGGGKPSRSQTSSKSRNTYSEGVNRSSLLMGYDPGEAFVDMGTEKTTRYIPTGAVFRARLITPIKTSLEKTFVMAETTNEFRMDAERKIPKGARLIGRSRLNPVLKGVIVEFDKLVLPDGIETNIEGLALSRNALPEVDGLYFSNNLETYGTALAFGFLSGFADAARDRELTFFGSQPGESVSNQVLSGLSTASFQVAEELLRDIRTRSVEYVVVPAREPIFVALTRRYIVSQGEEERVSSF